MWDQWWHGENKDVTGLLDTQCPLGQAPTCSQAHILCVCPVLEYLREDHLRSLATANTRLPHGPQRQLLGKYLDMVTTWLPLDDRVLLWTGMLSQPQRFALDPYIRRLPVARSRSLLTCTCRRLTRITRTVWVAFRRLVSEAAADDPQCGTSTPSRILDNLDYWDLNEEAPLDPPFRVAAPASTMRDPLVRLREEGDFG